MSGRFYRLSAAPLFEEDLNEIVGYTANRLHEPAAAVRFVNELTEAVFDRLSDPLSGPRHSSGRERPYPYYTIQVGGFNVYYVVIGGTMEVRRILRIRSRPPGDPSAGLEEDAG